MLSTTARIAEPTRAMSATLNTGQFGSCRKSTTCPRNGAGARNSRSIRLPRAPPRIPPSTTAHHTLVRVRAVRTMKNATADRQAADEDRVPAGQGEGGSRVADQVEPEQAAHDLDRGLALQRGDDDRLGHLVEHQDRRRPPRGSREACSPSELLQSASTPDRRERFARITRAPAGQDRSVASFLRAIRVQPGARTERVGGAIGPGTTGATSPASGSGSAPVRSTGRRTAAAARAVAAALDVRPRQVSIVKGHTAREKLIKVTDPPADIAERWAALLLDEGPPTS